MDADLFQSAQSDWSLPVGLTLAIALTAAVYVRGWLALRKTRAAQFNVDRLLAFLGGLACLWIAIGSPLESLADDLLSAHMIEHLLLMSFAPPLLLLGSPQVPLLRGLPRVFTIHVLGPLFRERALRELGRFLLLPAVAWLAMNLSFLIWHVPSAYDFALEHERWHDFEHICFLGSSIFFWWPLVRPWPTRANALGWYILPYLVGADIVNTALSAFLAFCERPVYPYYFARPNPLHIAPLADQVAGAVVMWVIGSMIFLVPAVALTVHLLGRESKLRSA